MLWRSARVSVGDRFAKVGQPSRVFIVVALDELPDARRTRSCPPRTAPAAC